METVAVSAAKRARNANIWARVEFDFYVEPEIASAALFKAEGFVGGIWDPACGQGNICRSAVAAQVHAAGTDIVRRVDYADTDWFQGENDFLAAAQIRRAPNIVCNPPFYRAKGTEAFIRQAIRLAPGKVAIFAPIGFLTGVGRAEGLFLEHPPSRAWIIVPRVSCPPGAYLADGHEAKGGTEDWCWLIWSVADPKTRTEIRWLGPEGEIA